MSRKGWHIQTDRGGYTLARHWPPRFDVQASSAFPPARKGRLAQQVRQDLWRAFQGLRGFSPVIEVAATQTGLSVTAGGRLMAPGPVPADLGARIKALLDDPAHRARWLAWARKDAA